MDTSPSNCSALLCCARGCAILQGHQGIRVSLAFACPCLPTFLGLPLCGGAAALTLVTSTGTIARPTLAQYPLAEPNQPDRCTACSAYSYGVMMWASYYRQPPCVHHPEHGWAHHPYFGAFGPDAYQPFADLARDCLSMQPEARPPFSKIVARLEGMYCMCNRSIFAEPADASLTQPEPAPAPAAAGAADLHPEKHAAPPTAGEVSDWQSVDSGRSAPNGPHPQARHMGVTLPGQQPRGSTAYGQASAEGEAANGAVPGFPCRMAGALDPTTGRGLGESGSSSSEPGTLSRPGQSFYSAPSQGQQQQQVSGEAPCGLAWGEQSGMRQEQASGLSTVSLASPSLLAQLLRNLIEKLTPEDGPSSTDIETLPAAAAEPQDAAGPFSNAEPGNK